MNERKERGALIERYLKAAPSLPSKLTTFSGGIPKLGQECRLPESPGSGPYILVPAQASLEYQSWFVVEECLD